MTAIDTLIRQAYSALDRRLFMDEHRDMAWLDAALPIGYGQTISQPSLVLSMTLALKPFKGCSVLEIGTGSGYQTALLSTFAKTVYTVERLEPLYYLAMERLERLGYTNILFRHGDGWTGWPDYAPYDRIIVTAAAPTVPRALLEQLAPEGVMIIPVGMAGEVQELLRIQRDEKGRVSQAALEYVRFVPLVEGPDTP